MQIRTWGHIWLGAWLLVSFFASSAQAAAWWNSDWQWRREIKIADQKKQDPEDEVAYAEILTDGRIRADGLDLVVTDAEGNVIPSKIIFLSPSWITKIVFQAKDLSASYFAYFGNTKASSKDLEPYHPASWQPERGLLLEIRRKPKGDCNDWKQMQNLIERSKEVDGIGYRPKIWDGGNVFGGLPANFISIYRGYLICPSSGKYGFATASDDASFLLIDGKLVAQYPGVHDIQGGQRAEHRGEINLAAGKHRIEYYHVQFGGGSRTLAAWKKPGDKKYEVIPESAFPRLLPTQVGRLESAQNPVVADFQPTQKGAIFLGDNQFTEISFANQSSGNGLSFRWQFGDGTESTEANPSHISCSLGQRQVILTVQDQQGRKDQFELIVPVKEDVRAAQDKGSGAKFLAQLITYSLDDLDLLDLWRIARLTEAVDDSISTIRLAQAYLRRAGESPHPDYRHHAYLMLGDAYLSKQVGKHQEALAAYQEAARYAPGETALIAAQLRRADALALNPADREAALAAYRKMVADHEKSKDPQVATAQIRVGDLLTSLGRYREAEEAYRKVPALRGQKYQPEKDAVRRGAYIQTISSYLNARRWQDAWETIQTWEDALPWDKLTGLPGLYRGKAKMGFKEYQAAIDLLKECIRVNRAGTQVPEAKLLIGEAYYHLGQIKQGTNYLEQVVDQFPATTWALTAKQLLRHPPTSERREIP